MRCTDILLSEIQFIHANNPIGLLAGKKDLALNNKMNGTLKTKKNLK